VLSGILLEGLETAKKTSVSIACLQVKIYTWDLQNTAEVLVTIVTKHVKVTMITNVSVVIKVVWGLPAQSLPHT
jgi:hypothetical protein